MTDSPRPVAREAPQPTPPARSRKDFTAHHLFAVRPLRPLFKADHRGIAQLLTDFADLRKDLGLDKVTRFATLCYAAARLQKRGRP